MLLAIAIGSIIIAIIIAIICIILIKNGNKEPKVSLTSATDVSVNTEGERLKYSSSFNRDTDITGDYREANPYENYYDNSPKEIVYNVKPASAVFYLYKENGGKWLCTNCESENSLANSYCRVCKKKM